VQSGNGSRRVAILICMDIAISAPEIPNEHPLKRLNGFLISPKRRKEKLIKKVGTNCKKKRAKRVTKL